jgi:hypothetical protein
MSIRTPFLAAVTQRIVSSLYVPPASADVHKVKTLDSGIGSTDSVLPARVKIIPPTKAALLRSFGSERGDRNFNCTFPDPNLIRRPLIHSGS